MQTIDFSYAFAKPYRMTLSRPSASEKVLADADEKGIQFSWSWRNLREEFPLAWTGIPLDVSLLLDIMVGGKNVRFSSWYRHESGAPCLFARGSADGVAYCVSAIAAKTGVVVKTELENVAAETKEVSVRMAHTSGWVISNRGWIDGIHKNLLMTMNSGRADRILVLAYGADDYPIYGCASVQTDSLPPMTDSATGAAENSMKKITAYYRIDGNGSKAGYFLLPYKRYFEQLALLKAVDPEKEFAAALREWKKLLSRSASFEIADRKLLSCYYACLADLFVMREKIGKYTGITCGTLEYRSANSGEPLETEILLDTLGYTKEALTDYRMYLEGQDESGCWATSKGWEHECWGAAFNKANAVLEHYYITRDKEFLRQQYGRMRKSTLFNHAARQSTKNAEQISARGLMPRGMGDCGMMNGADYYGIFFPTNCQSVAADAKTVEAAAILGETEDVAAFSAMVEEAKADLLASIRRNLVAYPDFVMMPAAADAPVSSMYGCMFPFFPCCLVDGDDPMIAGAVKFIEGKRKSEGGLPMGTGWLKDGLWVAMALGSIARTYLRLGLYQRAYQYLYPALNHASPYVTYCEERGVEKGSAEKTGDMQHLWTPLSVCQYMVEAFWFEDEKAVHLCAGIVPEWLTEGKTIGITGLKTHYGDTAMRVAYAGAYAQLQINTERPMEKDVLLHLPDGTGSIVDRVVAAAGKTAVSARVALF